MKAGRLIISLWSIVVLLVCCASIAFAAPKEKPGFKDPELFTRMPGFVGTDYKFSEYSKFDFVVAKSGKNSRKTVEGRYTWLNYELDPASGRNVSNLQVIRNFQNAITKKGGKVVFDDGGNGIFYHTTLMIAQQGAETWVKVRAIADKRFELTIVEMQAMAQEVAANPMLDTIRQTGKVTLYINFDTGSATIKPDSSATVDQIVAMLDADKSIDILIEGHTDSTGDPAGNQRLSEMRAKSVMSAVSSKGIDRSRLTAKGFGRTKPVADNATAEGRAKNRRVELVKTN